eukprot:GHRQ01023065.1.p2 GENE.GHRQ01023065.1~~GHRQ01023065.1.p2  ORF type:complete len:124 (+),score=19.23 GHRQ01023065.1:191-562(+)
MSAVGPTQPKRQRVEEHAQEYQEEYNHMVGPQLPGPEGLSDAARVHILEQKLQHLRGWMSQLAAMLERSNMQAAQNARRLFVGGLPADVTQVGRSAGVFYTDDVMQHVVAPCVLGYALHTACW